MTLILTSIFFLFGLIIGSFLNVVILRLHTERSFGGRSACMVCGKTLSWYELFPVLSYIFLRGRCKHCKTKISLQYPIVELISGVLFALLFYKFQYVLYFSSVPFFVIYTYYSVMFSLLLIIAVYDLRHKIILDKLALLFGIIGFVGLFLFSEYRFFPHMPSLSEFGAGFALSVPFALVWFVSKGEWMGLGDAKLALGLGWMLGMSSLLSGAVLAFWSGGIIGLILLLFSKKYKIKSEVPFAPFLAAGGFVAFLFEISLFVVNF